MANPDQDFEIRINTRPHRVDSATITFEQLVVLAYPTPPGPNFEYTITYRNGPEQNPQGALYPGQSVFVKSGMSFIVGATDKS